MFRMWVGVAIVAFAGQAVAAGFTERFENAPGRSWAIADYDFDHPGFDTDWRREMIRFDGGLTLGLAPRTGGNNRFVGSALRRRATTGYGYYEATLRPAPGAGIVTGFFLYTGPAYGTRHDEIDIEFLGRSMTSMIITTFVDGNRWSREIPLGFDARDGLHRYGFDWQRDQIRWFVDGREVYRRSAADGPLPQLPARLFVNLWAASPALADWAGQASEAQTASARVAQINFVPASPTTLNY